MRLRTLRLTRYGIFTDHEIVFGPRKEDTPDLHVIYGPNEAGKSTALAGYLDLLFGIRPQSPYGFRHPYQTMLVGGVLEFQDGTIHDLDRIKRQKDSLLGRNGQPAGESLMAGLLRDIERDTYRTMFSLDDESLEDGGREILASKGDLGRLLFQASAGLVDLGRTLDDLRRTADEFHRPRSGEKTELGRLKARLKELKAQQKSLDLSAGDYTARVEACKQARSAYEEAAALRSQRETEAAALRARLTCLADYRTLMTRRDELRGFEDLPEPPNHWLESIPELATRETTAATRHADAGAEIQRLEQALQSIEIDEAVLTHAARIESLDGNLGGFETVIKELPRLRAERERVAGEIEDSLRRLGAPGGATPETLLLAEPKIGAFEELIGRGSGLQERLSSARSEHDEARERLERTREEFGDSEIGRDLTSLQSLVTSLRRSDHDHRRRMAEKEKDRLLALLADQRAALAPWSGAVEDLVATTVPETTRMADWKAALETARATERRHADTMERLSTAHRQLEAELKAMVAPGDAIDDEHAAMLRARRDSAWALHRSRLDQETARAFEASMREYDALADERLLRADEVARAKEKRQRLAGLAAELASTRDLRTKAEEETNRIAGEVARAVAVMALPVHTAVLELEGWLARRAAVLKTRATLQEVDRELASALADGKAARERMATALATDEISHATEADLETLLELAQRTIDHDSKAGAVLREREDDLKHRARTLKDADRALEAWREEWDSALSGCWFEGAGRSPSTSEVGCILAALPDLERALSKRNDQDRDIRRMEAERDKFTAEARTLAEALGETFDQERARDGLLALRSRLRTARNHETSREEKGRELEEARLRLRRMESDMVGDKALVAEITALFGVASMTEVSVRRDRILKRREIQMQVGALEDRIMRTLNEPDRASAEALLAAANRADLDTTLTELEGRLKDDESRCLDLHAAWSKAKDALAADGADGDVAKLKEEQQTVLLETEQGALTHLRLLIGIEAAERGLRIYRDRHRSSMLTRASQAFQTITRGDYVGLSSQPAKGGEVLIARSRDGGSKTASELSKGTVFGLYLALRDAGYHEFVGKREPLPFIADDIMETFDDHRAEQAFRLLAGLATMGQAIYLTHHRHLCEIAREACPAVTVHELPALGNTKPRGG